MIHQTRWERIEHLIRTFPPEDSNLHGYALYLLSVRGEDALVLLEQFYAPFYALERTIYGREGQTNLPPDHRHDKAHHRPRSRARYGTQQSHIDSEQDRVSSRTRERTPLLD